MKNEFENKLARLGQIVEALEGGNCSLEESMSLFEEGIKLSKECGVQLENSKQKIITLSQKENGEE